MEKTLLEEIQENYKNPKPKKEVKPENPKKSKPNLLARWVYLSLGLATIVFLVECGVILWSINLWSKFHNVEPQRMLIFNFPLKITKVEYQSNPITTTGKSNHVVTEEEKIKMIYGAGYGKIISKIRTLESTDGKAEEGHHQFCNRIGKSNEFGYFKNGNRFYCFESFEESVQEVAGWIESSIEEMPLAVALCYYNTGHMTADCTYWQNFKKL